MKDITTILFDLDGTLTDPKEGIIRCIQYALDKMGTGTHDTDSLIWVIGPPLKTSFSKILDTSDEQILTNAIAHYRERFGDTGMYENILYPEIPEALETIRNTGRKIMLATSKPEVYAVRILEFMDIMKYFDVAYGSMMDGSLADKARLIEHIIARENLSPENTMIIGDRKHDIMGGKANGIITAAVTYGYGTREELEEAGPDFIFDSMLEAAAFIKEKL
ncbi:MAG TPA: HAD hydrolase-like protein [Desulfomonilia bacterium]